MSATRKWLRLLAGGLLLAVPGVAYCEARLSKEWPKGFLPDGRLVPADQYEPSLMKKAAEAVIRHRDAVVQGGYANLHFPFMLFIDHAKYYLQPTTFMAKSRRDEVCTPSDYDKSPTYKCDEGQRYAKGCHLVFLDSSFKEAGFHTVRINEPYQFYCNAMPSLGVYDKARNELLVTVQYFPINRKLASKISEIGSGWQRMTVLLRVKALDGKIQVEQDDRCLGNPNKVESVPDARKLIKRCTTKSGALK